jgi:hypothetical protein
MEDGVQSTASAPAGHAHAVDPHGARKRRAVAQVAGGTSALLAAAIVLMANYLAFRHYARFDWTAEGVYTLSPKSLEVVRKLDRGIDVYVFLSRGEPAFEDTDELLQRYRAASPRVRVRYVDPDREPADFQVLAQRFGVGAGLMAGTGQAVADVAAVVARGDKSWHVDRDDLAGVDFGGMDGEGGGESVHVKAEQALTGAIVQVTSGRATKVCVTRGHGELSLDDGGERSLGSLKSGLRHDNIEWEAVDTLGKKELPKGCDAVFVVGPAQAFSEQEASLLGEYLRAGGSALFALDPVIEHDTVRPTGLESMLQGFGVRLDATLVIELNPERLLTPNTVEFIATEFGDHATTRGLSGRAAVLVSLARSVALTQNDGRAEIVLRTSDRAFGEMRIADVLGGAEPARGPDDVAGPVTLAVALQVAGDPEANNAKPGGRVVVIGDSDWLLGRAIEAPELANFHLASAWTGWLTEREALIAIPPKKVKGGDAMFTQDDLGSLLFKVGVLIPGAAAFLGIAVWLNRRA